MPWQVDQLTRTVYGRSLTSNLELGEAERLRIACAMREGRADERDLSEESRAVYALLTARDAGAADAAMGWLPTATRLRLDAMSPEGYLSNVYAPLILLAHDRNDSAVPIGRSRRLIAALAGRAGLRYTEFTMFKHLDRTKVRLTPVALTWE